MDAYREKLKLAGRLRKEKRYREALALYKEIEAGGDNFYLSQVGYLYYLMGEFSNCLLYIERALRLGNRSPFTKKIKLLALAKLGSWDEIETCDVEKNDIRELIWIIKAKGNIELAKKLIKRRLPFATSTREKAKLLSLLASMTEDLNESARLYKEAKTLIPESKFLTERLLVSRTEKIPRVDAIRELELLLLVPTHQENPHIHSLLGRLYSKEGDEEKALECFKKAYELSKTAFNRNMLGFSYKRLGMYKEAKELLSVSFLEEPENYYTRTALFNVLNALGEKEVALSLISRALSTHPGVKTLFGLMKKVEKWS
ncbi:hypothetical protein CH333_03525 [candidate division WOR-3 bacterium JGI_Cruoil_03_44_89]|uniref:Tetratricopeptide repeat protein n=1 Tax=candidate division WOR-3 bacterium JGI_Cruoil_03_44_89 TaxID=1973748 RepID=A0A235BVF6_UNCW3|nr:MAG: hypothetical protein CH333_03525 [candidate division WOR-3 bacterium JGI_Cruoil_03_44_89]